MSARYKHGMNWIRQEKRLSIYMRDHFCCLYCGRGIEEEIIMTLDHVKHFGGNHVSNLVTACMDCNVLKHWRSLKTFLMEICADAQRAEVLRLRVERACAKDVKKYLPEAKRIIAARKVKEPF